jgi:hypothetical protein
MKPGAVHDQRFRRVRYGIYEMAGLTRPRSAGSKRHGS